MRVMEPESIGSLRLENRIVMLATHLSYCNEGVIPRRLIDFYVERARYRPGLIIVGGCYTEHLGMSSPTMIGISDDSHIEGLRALVDSIHKFGVPVAAQLYHAGRYAYSFVLGEEAVSASAVPCRLTRETPRALTIEEIRETVHRFGLAAARARRAGFDAVEIIGSAGYLINQFLAPVTNQRSDEYGGDLESRARFPLEVIRAVRDAVGPSLPILYRMSGEDFVEGGLTLKDNQVLAPMFERAGVDAFNVTGGWHETRVPQLTMDVPRGHYAYLAEGIAEVVRVPVIACNRINSVSVAEHILSRGKARLIGMARALIADPALPEKVRTGRQSEVRPCIACNQGCLDHVFTLTPLTCAINPQAGFEEARRIGPPGEGRVAVVGAGPAGLEASRVLALRGFDVTLYEKRRHIGGQLRLAARVPGRSEFAAYISHMEREMRRLSVRVRLEKEVTRHHVSDYDFVICATGSLPLVGSFEGAESAGLVTVHEILEHPITGLGRVVVIGGSGLGCYGALHLATSAEEVHLIEAGDTIGGDIGRTTRWVILKALHDRGVHIHEKCEVMQAGDSYVVVHENGEPTVFTADLVVSASGTEPDRRLYDQLDAAGVPCALLGAAERTMDLLDVIHSAFQFANRFENVH